VSGHLNPGGLNPGGQQFRGDRGAADPRVAAALAAYQAGQGSEQAALGALAASRLLVPVVAVLTGDQEPRGDQKSRGDQKPQGDQETQGKQRSQRNQEPRENQEPQGHQESPGDKNSEMMLPKLIGRDGRPAVLAFTGLDALARWRPDARPVPAEADRVWRAAAADGCAVVIDVAGPVPLAVEGARLAALAAGRPVPLPHEDPDVRAEVQAAVAAEPAITGFTLAPGRGDGTDSTDLAVTLHLAAGAPTQGTQDTQDIQHMKHMQQIQQMKHGQYAQEKAVAVQRAAAAIAARLGPRLRRGIELIVAEGPQRTP
jgi:SseB protein N-terminal domain